MNLVDHPNVLKSHCSFVSGHNLWVVMPFMAGGSCLHILKAAYPDGFEELVIATILREVLKGLDYLHHHGHIHRDVKKEDKAKKYTFGELMDEEVVTLYGILSSCAQTEILSYLDPWSTKNLCKSIDFYSSVFKDFVSKAFLSPNSKALCLETLVNEDVLALREIGVIDSFGISKRLSLPMIISGKAHRQPFDDNVFDFEFSGIGILDH
ncbi:cAMP-dependent protein kinase type 2-like [Quercus lobata]|uniref:cAMP-dependent protein kinase type 2-like n=1 Tax=Quercus lobata TaxID=97700 RepID=UPI001246989B|nr:cAMP-dependent protein kinase type 2-like [Quercus lobata]